MDYREEAIECVKDHVLPIHQQIYAKYNGDFDRIYSEGYNSKSYQGRVKHIPTIITTLRLLGAVCLLTITGGSNKHFIYEIQNHR